MEFLPLAVKLDASMSSDACSDKEEHFTLRDNAGRPYSLRFARCRESWVFRVTDRGTPVGLSKCVCHGRLLFLGDIRIDDSVRPRWPEWLSILCYLPLRRSPRNYQWRGLGTALLLFIIQNARQSGIKRIEGNLFAKDLGNNPRLPDWYRRHGFDVQMEADMSSGKVWLELGGTG